MEEVWVPVKGYEGIYEVSNFGRVKSLEITTIRNNGWPLTNKEKILNPVIDNFGYYRCCFNKGLPKKHKRVHSLVAIAFCNHVPNGRKQVVNHIDGNKLNNHFSNLESVTHRANVSTCFRKNEDKFTSKYVGVSWSKECKKWKAQISINMKAFSIGYFDSEIEASNAYQQRLSTI
jgi:hypothetical protein